jgi:hypothetical protein
MVSLWLGSCRVVDNRIAQDVAVDVIVVLVGEPLVLTVGIAAPVLALGAWGLVVVLMRDAADTTRRLTAWARAPTMLSRCLHPRHRDTS